MNRRIVRTLAIAAVVAVSGIAAPEAAKAQSSAPPAYSAKAMHQYADGTLDEGRVVKSGLDMRMEYDVGGRRVIQIIRGAAGVMLMLDPTAKTWMELRGAPGVDSAGSGYMPPCQENDPMLNCSFAGTEVTSGITAEIWQVARKDQPDAVATILWDGARHKALKQTNPDGSTVALTYVAMADVGGRQAEHWTVETRLPGQEPMAGAWYYDPDLRVAIREEDAGGEMRWLEDITVGPVAPELFEPPAGWTRLEMPAPGNGSGAGPGAN